MNIEQIQACADVLGKMADHFANMPTGNTKALQAGLSCVIARSLAVEYAAHLSAGMEPYDALEATANGELQLPESTATILAILTANPKQ